jgi:hypothetical protein
MVSKDAPGLALNDENGKVRAWLDITNVGPSLRLLDEYEKQSVGLAVSKYGPGLALSDENGKVRAWLAVIKAGPGLVLNDETGRPIWSQP